MIDRSQYCIGFNDMLSQMKFMWSDGSPIHYTNWAENEPNNWLNHNEDCVGIFLKVCNIIHSTIDFRVSSEVIEKSVMLYILTHFDKSLTLRA